MAAKLKIGDYVTLQRGTTYKGNLVGKPGPALLGLGSIKPGGGFREGDFKTYGGDCPSKLMLFPGDLFVSLKGATKDGEMIGSVARVPCSVPSGRLTQDTVKLVFLETDLEFQKYLYWALRTPHYRAYCAGRATGSAVVALSREDFLSYPIEPLDADKTTLVDTFESIESLIEVNRKSVLALEQIAASLFKSWFVDFDPVRAKADGRMPSGMDAATVSLFPEKFQESILGQIPFGWRVCPIRDVVHGVFDGPHATPPDVPNGPVFLGIGNFTGTSLDLTKINHISEADWPRWTKRVTPRGGDIVFTYEATLGRFAIIPPWLRCCLGRRTALVRPSPERHDGAYLFHWFTGRTFQEFLTSRIHPGATVDRILLSDFPDYPVLCPPPELIARFESLASVHWQTIHAGMREVLDLVATRDALLPKLLSGELSPPATVGAAP